MEITNGTYSVYIHTNRINNKRYVGITCKNPIRRWGVGGAGYKTQTYFWRAIKKYGWENFEHEIVASNLTEEEACNFEVLLIKELRTQNPRYGYNYERGGRCHDEQARKRIGDSERGEKHHYYGKHRDKETCEKISKALSGENHPCYGKHLSETTRQRISQSEKGVQKPKNNPILSVSIRCVETGVVYPSLAEVKRQLGIHHSGISMVLNGKRQTAGGFHWEYYDPSKEKSVA